MNKQPTVIAIIPARGGSKGVPRKNIRLLGGKPLIAYSIEQALKSKLVNRTIVSTEDVEIAQISRECGAEIVERPAELAVDTAGSETALLHVLQYLETKEKYVPDLVVFLQATSPLRQENDIDNAIRTLIANEADSLFSCCRTHDFYWNVVEERIEPINYDYKQRPRRQDRKPEYIENGSIYVTKTRILRDFENRLGGKISNYEMGRLDSFQIDDYDDFLLIEQLVKLRKVANENKRLKSIKAIFLDFDGVMTDNRVIVSENGQESVICSRSDGLGIELIKKVGIPVIVISKEPNSAVSARCTKLDIPCFQNIQDKLTVMKDWSDQNNMKLTNCAYVGNDINDIECMKASGSGIAVADAHKEVLNTAAIILKSPGGNGAIRELAEMILSANDLK